MNQLNPASHVKTDLTKQQEAEYHRERCRQYYIRKQLGEISQIGRTKKITDRYTNLAVSRQRKHQLRNREAARAHARKTRHRLYWQRVEFERERKKQYYIKKQLGEIKNRGGKPKIKDEFTYLRVSRQRKHQLRHPEYRRKLHKILYWRDPEHRRERTRQYRIRKLLGEV